MTPLANNPALRKTTYIVFFFVSLAFGAIRVGYAATDNGAPDWLKAALAAIAFIGSGIGYMAQANVGNPAQPGAATSSISLDRDERPEGFDA
jgi:hypothetical protein